MIINVSKLFFGEELAESLPQLFSLTEGVVVCQKTDNAKSLLSRNGYRFELLGSNSLDMTDDLNDNFTSPSYIEIISTDISSTMLALADILGGATCNTKSLVMPFRGIMLDASRNGVPTVEFLKPTIARLALLGMTHFCLYTEDTFQVDSEPLIGYARGVYSKDEIRELVRFSSILGVTMFPCFQTLGHLEQILKYEKYEYLHDNHRVLNTKLDETYDFIDKLIDEICEPYDTNLIHLGMDEPWGIGRGKSFDCDAPKAPSELYVEHVNRVVKMCDERGLKPIIWGDYVLGHPDEKTSSDAALTVDELRGLPKNVILDYWNYFDTVKDPYLRDIEVLQKMGYDIIASPGLQTWNNYWGKLELCESVTTPFIKSAIEMGVSRAMMTIWGDDGHECLFQNNWAAIAHFMSLTIGTDNDNEWKERLKVITGVPYENYLLISKIEDPDFSNDAVAPFVPSAKMLFYDDPLLGFVNKMCQDSFISEYYSELIDNIRLLECSTDVERARCQLAELFLTIVVIKFELIRDVKKNYKLGDKEKLKALLPNCDRLITTINKFRRGYCRAWMNERKPFGFEVLDNRIGAMAARVDTFKYTLSEYLSDSLESISEFELEHCCELTKKDLQFYPKIVTKCFSIW